MSEQRTLPYQREHSTSALRRMHVGSARSQHAMRRIDASNKISEARMKWASILANRCSQREPARSSLKATVRYSQAVPSPGLRRAKRAVDLLITVLLLVVVSPLLLLVGGLVSLDGGPILFRHARIGLRGRSFQCLKFRSMRVDSDRMLADLLTRDAATRREWETHRKLRKDPRITLLGRFIRATSIDELPQLFNVLRGEMSLVGPRPIVEEELDRHYGDLSVVYTSVRPGITGLWQVNGRSQTTYKERVQLDLSYVRSCSILGDFAILWRTIGVVLKCGGAY